MGTSRGRARGTTTCEGHPLARASASRTGRSSCGSRPPDESALTYCKFSHLRSRAMQLKLRLAWGGVVFAWWLAFASGAAAQTETAKIDGRITVDQGAVLPAVTVTATVIATKVARTTVTDAAGAYLFASVQPAEYEI